MKKANLFNLNWRDVLKGLIMAFISAVVTGVYQLIQTNGIISWVTIKPVIVVGIGAGLSYLIKNYFTNSTDQFATKENPAIDTSRPDVSPKP